jgi:hypothetical protein
VLHPKIPADADSSPFAENFSLVNKNSNIPKPDDHRNKYERLGTRFVRGPVANQMHIKYTLHWVGCISGTMESSLTEQCLLKRCLSRAAKETTGDAHGASGTRKYLGPTPKLSTLRKSDVFICR